MLTRLGLVPTLLISAVLLAILTFAGVALYIHLPPEQTASVAVPPPTASPQRVIRSFVAALNAHDCTTADALVVGNRVGPDAWCQQTASITHLRIQNETNPGNVGWPAAQVVNYNVAFDYRGRPLVSDGSMPDGLTAWGYSLAKQTAHSPWRIFDDGTG